jgi:hypothetical protein
VKALGWPYTFFDSKPQPGGLDRIGAEAVCGLYDMNLSGNVHQPIRYVKYTFVFSSGTKPQEVLLFILNNQH